MAKKKVRNDKRKRAAAAAASTEVAAVRKEEKDDTPITSNKDEKNQVNEGAKEKNKAEEEEEVAPADASESDGENDGEDEHDEEQENEGGEDFNDKGDDDDDDDDDNDQDDDDNDNDDVSSEEDDEETENNRRNDSKRDEGEIKSSTVPTKDPSSSPSPVVQISDGRYRNKQRCLVICSRGVTARYRHLLEDIRTLLPHHRKDSKLDPGKTPGGFAKAVNDIAEMKGCNTVLFLECRKRRDAYLWMGRTVPTAEGGLGPSVKFHVTNIHTMDELRLTGNCMKGSRPILTFDHAFEKFEYLKLLKHLFVDVFGTPRGHPKSKPFVDRVMGFYFADGKIWVRNYQIVEQQPANAKEARLNKKQFSSGETKTTTTTTTISGGASSTTTSTATTSLVEIGPRFVLNPIRVFRGSFGGQTLYQNRDFVSPNETRSMEMRNKGNLYVERKEREKRRKLREKELVLPEDPLDNVFH